MHLDIRTIPHLHQRYDTCGDYWQEKKTNPRGLSGPWQFRISNMSDPDFEFLVLMHELTEWWWAKKHHVPMQNIDTFDKDFERVRQSYFPDSADEPGDHPQCPVYLGHQMGSAIERVLATMLGINWQAYEKDFDALPQWNPGEP